MEKVDVVKICEKVLKRLSLMDYERKGGTATEQLIFPNKFPSKEKIEKLSEKELLKYIRRSEQELRQIFIDVFKEYHSEGNNKLYYSIETPTAQKHKFGKSYDDLIKHIGLNSISALIDMCVFQRDEASKYERILNIEFKHGNAPIKDIAKDVLKLMREKENGAFIFLLDNTNKGSLNNIGETRDGVLDKLSKSFEDFRGLDNIWNENESKNKHIQIIILSLEQKTNAVSPTLISKTFFIENLNDLDTFFSINDNRSGNMATVCENSGWLLYVLKDNQVTVSSLRGEKQSHEANSNATLGMVGEKVKNIKIS
ncbi:hypothetical protein [Algibacter mikhailovii]|uniref:Uncharacterized protein n=1 Tax=Algibacter mikhailovii TaxID=425498 RepID=A0A918QUK8_9FLAO|nr:hypothetical protein [Algibacter mikhailovii]GGZ72535.1 hypothetical protein GCM10007028_06950 [Algibacter mikhailovii]